MKRKPKNPITKIRTGKGDGGQTYFKGEMLWKDSPIIEFLGSLDTACSAIGKIKFDEDMYIDWRLSELNPTSLRNDILHKSQVILFDIGGLVYTETNNTFKDNIKRLSEYVNHVSDYMEKIFKKAQFPELNGFIIPNPYNADIMFARALVREAERCAVYADCLWAVPALNVMSDYLFLVAWFLGGYTQWTGFNKGEV
jgi:ATP:cob(I)alamin adenosyltransferase